MNFKERYGSVALIAGASEGLGAAYSYALAKRGLNVILVARRKGPLEKMANEIRSQFQVKITTVCCDLADNNAIKQIEDTTGKTKVDFLVYNAALSFIGAYLSAGTETHERIAAINMLTPLRMLQHYGGGMVQEGKGGIILMSSLTAMQGSPFLAMYAATKAFNRILAESLWYEWKNKGVDVIACCAGATATPGYILSKPKKLNPFAPKVQSPEEVAEECLHKIGKMPSFIPGNGNKIASFFMSKLLSRKQAINTMGNTTRKMYQDLLD
jgi:short-subunit dehydrogenase